jgi:hypothetical protein
MGDRRGSTDRDEAEECSEGRVRFADSRMFGVLTTTAGILAAT